MRKILALFLMMALTLAGVPEAMAKAGGGSKSTGSRGSRTYDRPMERTTAPPPAQVAPGAPLAQPGAQPMYRQDAVRPSAPMAAAQPMAQPGFFQRNPFVAGMLGGLAGAGIGSMLFGHSPALAAASDAAPGASMFGLLMQLALIGGGIWLAMRLFRRKPAEVPAAGPYAREVHAPAASPETGAPVRVEKEFEAGPADQQAFTEILLEVQRAWSTGDLAAMGAVATPEIVTFLSEDLSRNAARGIVNKVEAVNLDKGDLTESWREDGHDFATALLTFSCIDVTVRTADGTLVEGDPRNPVVHTEAWTFVREAGGRWKLSAIEQV